MSVLVLVEHDGSHIKDATLAAVTAASQLGDVHALVVGNNVDGVAQAAAKIAGVAKVLVASSPALEHQLAEAVAPVAAKLMDGHDAFLAPATTTGKNIAPRVAALLDVMQVSDILSVEGPDTFTRPIYAGNAIATVKSKDAKKVITVRTTAFEKAAAEGGSASIEQVDAGGESGNSSFVSLDASEERAARAHQRQGHRLGRPRIRLVRTVPFASRSARRQARRGGRREPRRGRRGLCAQRLSGRPDRQDRRPAGLCRDRHFRRDPASRRDEGFEDDHRHQQGRGSADLPGRRHRPRRRPVQNRPGADREALKSAEELGDVGAKRFDRISAFHHDQRRQPHRGDAPRHRGIVAGLELEMADRVGFVGIGAIADDEQVGRASSRASRGRRVSAGS